MVNAVKEWEKKLLKQDPHVITQEDCVAFKEDADRFRITHGIGVKINTDIGEVEIKFICKEELSEGFLVNAVSVGSLSVLFQRERTSAYILYFSEEEMVEFENNPWLFLTASDNFLEDHAVLIITVGGDKVEHIHRGAAMPLLWNTIAA